MTTCPAGHDTQAADYCDVCGLAIEAGAPDALAGPLDSPAAPDGNACPNCSAANVPDALFCEACGYDFTTGQMPRPLTPPTGESPAPADPLTDPLASTLASTGASTGGDANPSPPPAEAWVAEVWIDPEWYADQKSEDPLPSPGLPAVVSLEHSSVLIGRASRSRGINPDIDLTSDNGISRRHAQLTTDGKRWFVEDLGSSNGTYVGTVASALPSQPVTVGQRQEIAADGCLYLGAWTKIVIRRAAPGES